MPRTGDALPAAPPAELPSRTVSLAWLLLMGPALGGILLKSSDGRCAAPLGLTELVLASVADAVPAAGGTCCEGARLKADNLVRCGELPGRRADGPGFTAVPPSLSPPAGEPSAPPLPWGVSSSMLATPAA